MTQLNKTAYEKLIKKDIEYLMRQERTLERDHIIEVLRDSVPNYFVEPEPTEHLKAISFLKKELTTCQAATDGDCDHPNCPQKRDGEPEKTGRHCPLPHWTDDEDY